LELNSNFVTSSNKSSTARRIHIMHVGQRTSTYARQRPRPPVDLWRRPLTSVDVRCQINVIRANIMSNVIQRHHLRHQKVGR